MNKNDENDKISLFEENDDFEFQEDSYRKNNQYKNQEEDFRNWDTQEINIEFLKEIKKKINNFK